MASTSPSMAQDERLVEQLSKLARQDSNPTAGKSIDADTTSSEVMKLVSSIPVVRHKIIDEDFQLANGYQKNFTPFKKGVKSKIDKWKDDAEMLINALE